MDIERKTDGWRVSTVGTGSVRLTHPEMIGSVWMSRCICPADIRVGDLVVVEVRADRSAAESSQVIRFREFF